MCTLCLQHYRAVVLIPDVYNRTHLYLGIYVYIVFAALPSSGVDTGRVQQNPPAGDHERGAGQTRVRSSIPRTGTYQGLVTLRELTLCVCPKIACNDEITGLSGTGYGYKRHF